MSDDEFMIVERMTFPELVAVSKVRKAIIRRYKDKCYSFGETSNRLIVSISPAPDEKYKYIKWEDRVGDFRLLERFELDTEATLLRIYKVEHIKPEGLRRLLEETS